jgi:hypothetical protein
VRPGSFASGFARWINMENAMLAKPLTKIGSSQGILLDKQILALVGATSPDTVFKITVEGEDKIILKVMSGFHT